MDGKIIGQDLNSDFPFYFLIFKWFSERLRQYSIVNILYLYNPILNDIWLQFCLID